MTELALLLVAASAMAVGTGQPPHVSRALLFAGVVVGLVFVFTRRGLMRCHAEAELRRTVAAESLVPETVPGGLARRPATWFPWALMLGGDAAAVWRGYLAAWWYRRWLHTRVFDPSAAELDYANARIELVLALLALGVAAVGVALVLEAQRRQRRALANAAARP